MARLVIATSLVAAACLVENTAVLQAQQNKPQPGLQSPAKEPTTAADDEFVKNALEAGKMEIALAKVGLQQTHNPLVKRFAQTLVDYHSKVNKELLALKRDHGQKEDAMSAPDHPQSQDMTKLRGAEFDRAFLVQVIKDHDEIVILFDKEASTGKDKAVKTFAQKTIPMLKEHLKTARVLNQNAPTETRGARQL
jgi:putative membrane protein